MLRLAILFAAFTLGTPFYAARCGGDFNTFVAGIAAEAASAGVPQGVISQTLGRVSRGISQ